MLLSLGEIDFWLLPNWKEYDRSDSFPYLIISIWNKYSFPFGFEPNGIPFGSESKGKLSLRSYSFQFKRSQKSIYLRLCFSKPYKRGHFIQKFHVHIFHHSPTKLIKFYAVFWHRFSQIHRKCVNILWLQSPTQTGLFLSYIFASVWDLPEDGRTFLCISMGYKT